MGTIILRQIPDPNTATSITADNLPLVGMDDNIIDRRPVRIASLDRATSRLPDLDRAILRARDHPLALAMKRNARNVPSMTFEREQGIGVCRLDIVELDRVVTGRSEESFVGGDT